MNEGALLVNFLIVGCLLFVTGMVGFLVRRNLIVMFLSIEMMLQGVSVSLVAWGRFHQDLGGQMLTLFIIAVAAAEACIALALILTLYLRSRTLDSTFWHDLREEGQPPYIDEGLPEQRHEERHWPRLTPAGIRPQTSQDEQLHRSQV
jgi:NADH-quinone oxidoreductase subunit K